MLKIRFDWDKAGLKWIERLPDNFRIGLIKGIREAMFYAEGKSKKSFLSGGGPPHPTKLTARTGHLRRNIKSGVDGTMGFLSNDVDYAVIHEEVPGLRPFLMPAIEDNMEKIEDIIMDNIVKAVK